MDNSHLEIYSKHELSKFAPCSILNSLPDAAMMMDLQGRVIGINPKFTELIGYSPSDIVGLSHIEVVNLLLYKDKVTYPEVIQAFTQAREGNPFTAKRKFYHKSGYTIPVDIYESQIKDKNEEPVGVLLLIKDRHSEFMVTITNLVNSSLEISQVLRNVTEVVVEHLDLSSNAIFLLDHAQNVLRLVSCNVFPTEDLDKVIIPLGEGAPGIIAQTRKPMYIANLHKDSRIPEVGRAVLTEKSSIGFPLICRDEILGVIAFDAENIREFSHREIHLFESIAGQVALAIYNADLFSRLEHLSITDGLTGVYNHRYFQVKLAEVIKEARQKSGFVALLFLDLDFFKKYNDTFGHPRGDDLLKEFTHLLLESVRPSDYVCRYGGEEFAIILQACPLDQAVQIAERIRVACETHEFYGIESLPKKRITVSIGVASYPQVLSPQELISKADQALYRAKLFRNCVEVID